MNLMVSFYRDILELDVKEPEGVKDFRDFYWVVFNTGSCSLVLHAGSKQRFGEDAPRIVFRVTDIHTARSTLIERGVELGEVRSPARDVLVCDGKDPEGNAFSLESQTNEATRTMMTVEMPNAPPTYVSVHSKRGLSIILLRDNKFFILAELVLIVALICLLPVLKFVSLLALFLLIMALLWLRGNTWSKLGMARPLNWRRTILLGLSFGVFFWLLRSLMIVPIVESFVHANPNLRVFSDIRGHLLYLLAALITSWTSVGVGEEMIFRGYLLNRFADLFGDNLGGWILALFAQAATFGVVHASQGPAGMIEVGIYGLLLGLLYMATRRNLWVCAIAHSLNDTIAFIVAFLP
jgi:membrane protease YdiL (CAAX protease family)